MHIAMPHFDGLERHLAQHLIWDVLETLAPPGEDDPQQQQSRNVAVAAILESFRPTSAFEAMLAAQLVALHHGAMGCYRWAMHAEPASANATRLRRDAMAMTRTMLAGQQAMQAKNDAPRTEAARRQVALPDEAGPEHAAEATTPSPPDGEAAASPELARRERGRRDPAASAAAVRALIARDSGTLTDDDLDALGRATATPDKPYDPSWRISKPPPPAPYWEELTPNERLTRYGWQSEEQIAAIRAAQAEANQKPPEVEGEASG